uniref:hypothetical protein n=1 Tax=Burkholderia cenocepacia TaxID=95486 RepID=UPI001ED902FB|nr:hypothetical protein [Burkholderia cenocepacia]
MDEYTIGMIANYRLLEMEQQTNVDEKLEIEHIRDDINCFKRILFNHAFYEGLKVTQWIGSECYELSLQSISSPTDKKSHINLHFTLHHTTESQELLEAIYSTHFHLELARYTDKAILTRTKEVFHQLAPVVLEIYTSGQKEFKWGEIKARTGGLIDELGRYEKWLRGQY